jgi:NitT/TauT family transport system permease protein
MKTVWNRSERLRWVFGFLFAVVLLWELLVWLFGVRTFILPAPSLVLRELVSAPEFYLRHGLFTLMVTLVGFGISAVSGVLLAVAIVYSKILDKTLTPALVSFNAVPKVALAPLFVIWMGTAWEPKVAIAVLISIFPIVIDSVLGLRSIDPEMVNLSKSCRASALKTLWKIRFPRKSGFVAVSIKLDAG